MIEEVLFGAGLGFAAAVQPGPLQAFLLSRVSVNGWRRTLPASLAPLLSDGPIALLAIIVVGRLPTRMQHGLQMAGGLLLLYFAWQTFRQWRDGGDQISRKSVPRTLSAAVLVNLLNPNPYLGWSLVLGPAALAAWEESVGHAVALIGSFYGALVFGLAGFILLVGSASRFGTRRRGALVGVSAGLLAILGVYLMARSVVDLWSS
jgi:threonine/homoserine/homoserine lactone efflux protein